MTGHPGRRENECPSSAAPDDVTRVIALANSRRPRQLEWATTVVSPRGQEGRGQQGQPGRPSVLASSRLQATAVSRDTPSSATTEHISGETVRFSAVALPR